MSRRVKIQEEAHMTLNRDQQQSDAGDFLREDLVELEARANHDLERHAGRFTTCGRGCWIAAEATVDGAIFRGRLRPVTP